MWSREILKTRAKISFKANYWKCVFVGFLLTVITGFTITLNFTKNPTVHVTLPNIKESFEKIFGANLFLIIGIIAGIFVGFAIGTLIDFFVINPLSFGFQNFFLCNRRDNTTSLDAIGYGFTSNYFNIVKVLFFKDLFIFLWSLLFIIPGIIKTYEYRMVPYILAENPDIDYKKALQFSKDMMEGNKWNTFILDLSFIGWAFLGGLTFGILLIFYVYPYIYATEVELFLSLAHPEEATNFDKTINLSDTVEIITK